MKSHSWNGELPVTVVGELPSTYEAVLFSSRSGVFWSLIGLNKNTKSRGFRINMIFVSEPHESEMTCNESEASKTYQIAYTLASVFLELS